MKTDNREYETVMRARIRELKRLKKNPVKSEPITERQHWRLVYG